MRQATRLVSQIIRVFTALLLLAACGSHNQKTPPTAPQSTASTSQPATRHGYSNPCPDPRPPQLRKYPDKVLIRYLDSIGRLSPKQLATSASSIVDSVYYSFPTLHRTFTYSEYRLLQDAIRRDSMDRKVVRKLFGNDQSLTDYTINGPIPISYFLFDSSGGEKDYAIIIGSGIMGWESYFYFFHGRTLIAKHNVFHHNEIELHSFRNEKGNTIVYYKYVYNWGSGVSQFHYFFYCYRGNHLVPCLNLLQQANQANYMSPNLWLQSRILSTSPLNVRMKYDWSILSSSHYTDTCSYPGITDRLIWDSCVVRFRWNDATKKYVAIYPKGKLTAFDIPTYYLTESAWNYSRPLFLRLHYPLLRRLLNDPHMRSSILYILDEMRPQAANGN